jgi:hypothetical protein
LNTARARTEAVLPPIIAKRKKKRSDRQGLGGTKRLNEIHNSVVLRLIDDRTDTGYVRLLSYYSSVLPLSNDTGADESVRFLLPNLWNVSFTSEIVMGGDGWTWAMDEYGRHPGDPQFKNKKQHEIDWVLHEISKREWAKKRVGKSVAQADEFRHGKVGDALMRKYLQEEGLLPNPAASEQETEEGTTTVPQIMVFAPLTWPSQF